MPVPENMVLVVLISANESIVDVFSLGLMACDVVSPFTVKVFSFLLTVLNLSSNKGTAIPTKMKLSWNLPA